MLYGFGPAANGYTQLDRPLLSKHFQILGWLCEEMVNYRRIEFAWLAATTLLSPSVMSRSAFQLQANEAISRRIRGIKISLQFHVDRSVETYRGNAIANAFNTNSRLEYGSASNDYLLRSVPRWYQNKTCNCIVSADCHDPLRVGPSDLFLPGLVIGCTPTDGLRLSTLECFFSSRCIQTIVDYLQYYINADGTEPRNFTPPAAAPLSFAPLDASLLIQFTPNSSIGSIINEAFFEQTNQSVSYEKYFAACNPLNCRYEYTKKNDVVYIVTSLLGLYGGLTVGLRVIIWNIARLQYAIRRRLRPRSAAVEPA